MDVESGTNIEVTLPEENGRYTVNLLYSGDDEHSSSSGVLYLIAGIDETNITGAIINTYPGDTVNITLNVTDEFGKPVLNGTAFTTINNITYNSTVINGTVTLNNILLPTDNGTYNYTVYYDGNNHYDDSTNIITLNLTKLNANVSVSNITGHIGETKTVFINLTDNEDNPINATVTVTLPNGNTINVESNTYLDIFLDTQGEFNLPVKFNGTSKYNPTENTYYANISDTGKKNVTIITPNITAKTNETVNITIDLIDNEGNPVNNGSITTNIDDKNYTTIVTNGTSTITITLPNTTGNYSYNIYYNGNASEYNNAIGILNLNIIENINPSNNTDKTNNTNNTKPNNNNKPSKQETSTTEDSTPKTTNNLSNIPTGNPILILLIALISIFILPIKKRY